MDKKNEQKILDEIRKRVLEKEKAQNKKREAEAAREATKEALADMTSLSRDEIDKIAKEVREEQEKKREKRNKIIIAAFIIAAILLYRYYGSSSSIVFEDKTEQATKTEEIVTDKPNSTGFVENFDNNANGWDIFDFDYNRFIESGMYVFEVKVDDWCYWDYVELIFPKKYTVEVTSAWNKGKFDEYGVMLYQDKKNYKAFQLNADGSTSIATRKEGTWIENTNWKKNTAKKGNNKDDNVQKIKVTGNSYQYFVNDNLVKSGEMNNLSVDRCCLRVCDEQRVTFKDVKITDDTRNGQVIFSDNFLKPNEQWKQKKEFKKHSYLKEGKFLMATNKEDHCYWADIPVQFYDKVEIALTSIWQKGEQSNYGLMIMQDNSNYFSCELMNNGSARLVKSYNGEYTERPDYKQTEYESNGTNAVTQIVKIDGQKISYYIEGVFIGSSNLNYFTLKRVGVRVCGHQEIAFDKLTVVVN